MKSRITRVSLALVVSALGLIAFAVNRSTPVAAEPLEQVCVCHATQQNKVEKTPSTANPNQKYILICPNGNSTKLQGHNAHPDDIFTTTHAEGCGD